MYDGLELTEETVGALMDISTHKLIEHSQVNERRSSGVEAAAAMGFPTQVIERYATDSR